jgi:hypothetical protein
MSLAISRFRQRCKRMSGDARYSIGLGKINQQGTTKMESERGWVFGAWFGRLASHASRIVGSEFASKVEIAATFQEDERSESKLLMQVWQEVQSRQLRLSALTADAQLFADQPARSRLEGLLAKVDDVANETNAFSDHFPEKLQLIRNLAPALRRAASSLGQDGRFHLGLGDSGENRRVRRQPDSRD